MLRLPSGHLPFEDEPREWSERFEADFAAARAPFDALRDFVLADNSTVRPAKPYDRVAEVVLMAQITKVLKAYRGMLMMCESGHGHEAVVLLRVVLEASAQIVWICRSTDSRHAAWQALAYQHMRAEIVLREADEVEAAGVSRALMEESLAKIPGATRDTIRNHWSGFHGFQPLCAHLGWGMHYLWIFRVASAAAHSSDASHHISLDQNDDMVLNLGAGDLFVRECLLGASVVLDQTIIELRQFGFAIRREIRSTAH